MNKYWFVPKKYGYGFYPVTWEGWASTIVLIGLVLLSVYLNDINSPLVTSKNLWGYLFDVALITSLFAYFAKNKTKGIVKWNWGNNKEK